MSDDYGEPGWEYMDDRGHGSGRDPLLIGTDNPRQVKAELTQAYQTGDGRKDTDERRLYVWTPPLESDRATDVLADSFPEGYNGFDRAKTKAVLRELPDEVRVVLGRELSPVIYIEKECPDYLRGLIDGILSGGGSFPSKPNEYGTVEDENGTEWIRMWWD